MNALSHRLNLGEFKVKSDCFVRPLLLSPGDQERTEGQDCASTLPISSCFLLPPPHLSISKCFFFLFLDCCSFLQSVDPWIFLDYHDFCWKTLTAEATPTFIYMLLFFCFLAPSEHCGVIRFGTSGTLPIKMCNSSKGWKWQWICLFPSNWGFLWILLSWKQVSFIEHTPTIMVKTSS